MLRLKLTKASATAATVAKCCWPVGKEDECVWVAELAYDVAEYENLKEERTPGRVLADPEFQKRNIGPDQERQSDEAEKQHTIPRRSSSLCLQAAPGSNRTAEKTRPVELERKRLLTTSSMKLLAEVAMP